MKASASDDDRDRVAAYDLNVAGYILKPVTLPAFVEIMAALNNYWAASEAMAGMQETHFRKNLAIMGGLLMLAYSGPGKWALGRPADS